MTKPIENPLNISAGHIFADLGICATLPAVNFGARVLQGSKSLLSLSDLATNHVLAQTQALKDVALDIAGNTLEHPLVGTMALGLAVGMAVENHATQFSESDSRIKTISELGITLMARYAVSLTALFDLSGRVSQLINTHEVAPVTPLEWTMFTLASISILKTLTTLMPLRRKIKYYKSSLKGEKAHSNMPSAMPDPKPGERKAIAAKLRANTQAIALENHDYIKKLKKEHYQRMIDIEQQNSLGIQPLEPIDKNDFTVEKTVKRLQERGEKIPKSRLEKFYKEHLKPRK